MNDKMLTIRLSFHHIHSRDISEFLGKTFILNIENSANDLDQHHVHVTVYNSSKLFSFSQHQYFAIIKENSPRHTKLDILGDLFVNPTRIKNTPRHHKLLEAAILLILSIPDH
jgi:hypothetical protein